MGLCSANHHARISLAANEAPRVCFSDKAICDDVLATIPKLRAAVQRGAGGQWQRSDRLVKSGIQLFQLTPAGAENGGDDLDIAHALMTKIRLRCHLNEVVNVVSHRRTSSYKETVQALTGGKIRTGRVLYHSQRQVHAWDTPSQARQGLSTATAGPRGPSTMAIGVQLLRLRAQRLIKLHPRSRRRQPPTLCFSSCTVGYPGNAHAYHVMKTVPESLRRQVLGREPPLPLGVSLDHLAVGFDIRKCRDDEGDAGGMTEITAHAYASTVPSTDYDDHLPSMQTRGPSAASLNSYAAADLAQYRESIMNPMTKRLLEVLVASVGEFETVIRRRRFGFQTFLTTDAILTLSATSTVACSVCSKNFTFFRTEYHCELCAQAVCRRCIRSVCVEQRLGVIYPRHCCIQCIHRVDDCTFEDEDLERALGPVVVDADTTDVDAWLESVEAIHSGAPIAESPELSALRSVQPVMPERPSLEYLAKIVSEPTTPTERQPTTTMSRL